jgi:hypothetical protein
MIRGAIIGIVALALTACTYAPEEERAVIAQIVRIGDSYRALVVVQHDTYRRPTGLSAFPDGGKWRYVERRAVEYLVDASERTIQRLAEQSAPDHLWESFAVHIPGVEGDSVAYLSMTGCPRDGECSPRLQRSSLQRLSTGGQVREVSELPAGVALPGSMVARRQGETRYVRFSSDGDVVTARFVEAGPFEPLFRLRDDGTLWVVDR